MADCCWNWALFFLEIYSMTLAVYVVGRCLILKEARNLSLKYPIINALQYPTSSARNIAYILVCQTR